MTAGVSSDLVPEPAEDDETCEYLVQVYEYATCTNELLTMKDTIEEHYTPDVKFICRVAGLLDHGRFPHPGGYLDQPAKMMQALSIYSAAKHYAKDRLRERQTFLAGGTT